MKSQIKKIGFEIEGEFSPLFFETCQGFGRMVSDGSLRRCCGSLDPYEFNSPAISIDKLENAIVILDNFKKAAAIKTFHWNDSCGFHIHVSFDVSVPPELLSSQFYDYFISNLKATFPEVWKARSLNTYCRPIPEVDLDKKEHHILNVRNHYDLINFKAAMEEHGTIEFRVWPSNDPDQMQKYLEFTIERINHFLENAHKYLIYKMSFPGPVLKNLAKKTSEYSESAVLKLPNISGRKIRYIAEVFKDRKTALADRKDLFKLLSSLNIDENNMIIDKNGDVKFRACELDGEIIPRKVAEEYLKQKHYDRQRGLYTHTAQDAYAYAQSGMNRWGERWGGALKVNNKGEQEIYV